MCCVTGDGKIEIELLEEQVNTFESLSDTRNTAGWFKMLKF